MYRMDCSLIKLIIKNLNTNQLEDMFKNKAYKQINYTEDFLILPALVKVT